MGGHFLGGQIRPQQRVRPSGAELDHGLCNRLRILIDYTLGDLYGRRVEFSDEFRQLCSSARTVPLGSTVRSKR